MAHKVKLKIKGSEYEYFSGVTLYNVSRDFRDEYPYDIILARVNGKLTELIKCIYEDADVEFVTTGDTAGIEVYKRTATMVMLHAFEEILGKDNIRRLAVQYSIDKGYYCELDADIPEDLCEGTSAVSKKLLDRVKELMKQIVGEKLPIVKKTVPLGEAIDIFREAGMYDKVNLFRFRRSSTVNIYMLDDTVDYFYGYMAPDTSFIRYFDLYLYDEGFVLQLPQASAPEEVGLFNPSQKVFRELKLSTRWGELLNVRTAGDVNETIAKGEFFDLMLVQEALQEKKIGEIAQTIRESGRRVVLIAGPTSSGKTTFSHRLSIQLRALGLTPHPVPVDNYFVNRENTPLGEDGNPDFECLGALDIGRLNSDVEKLLSGEETELPVFDFVSGKRESTGERMKIGEKDVLVLEGIHALNDAMTPSIPQDDKFKIYVSALTQLNIDEHNRIPTTDVRLIRRIVRDAARRGASASKTISIWPSVRRGEEKNIFPYQEDCDVMFNSALIYELAILKQYAEPLLFSVGPGEKEYEEARYLLKFLNYFLGVSSENIPNNSILREFIGGSCFNVE